MFLISLSLKVVWFNMARVWNVKSCLYFVPQVYVNEKRIYPAYSNDDLLLTKTSSEITLYIEAIKTTVIYRKHLFSINLPNSLFGGNTEGQCGESTEDKSSKYSLPLVPELELLVQLYYVLKLTPSITIDSHSY